MYPIMILTRTIIRFSWIATSLNTIRHFINDQTLFGVTNLIASIIFLVLIYVCDHVINYKFKNMIEYNEMLENLSLFKPQLKLYKTKGKDEFFQIKELKISLTNKIKYGPKFEKKEIPLDEVLKML